MMIMTHHDDFSIAEKMKDDCSSPVQSYFFFIFNY